MRTIRVTDEVWQAIAARGTFGETEDDVLRRVFELEARVEAKVGRPRRGNTRMAAKSMRACVSDGELIVEFEGGIRQQWTLPEIEDKEGIRGVRDMAVQWALGRGATNPGQTNTVRKALTSAGYYASR